MTAVRDAAQAIVDLLRGNGAKTSARFIEDLADVTQAAIDFADARGQEEKFHAEARLFDAVERRKRSMQ